MTRIDIIYDRELNEIDTQSYADQRIVELIRRLNNQINKMDRQIEELGKRVDKLKHGRK